MNIQRNLDHHVWKLLKHYQLQDEKILVALSGGADSVALLLTLVKTQTPEKVEAFYFHHGDAHNKTYRDDALTFCRSLCARRAVPFHWAKTPTDVTSEGDYRELRYAEISRLRTERSLKVVALAHHADDLLETRMLRLIRGTGGQGLAAMSPWRDGLFRPFLSQSKKNLLEYLAEEDQIFLEDPTNRDLDPLRNWLREAWLPQLEARAPGSLSALARSLDTIVQELGEGSDLLMQNGDYVIHGLQRSYYLTLSTVEQKRLLAQYLFALGKRNFSQSHLEEIQKRLDKSQKVITFNVGGSLWEINAEQIKVQS